MSCQYTGPLYILQRHVEVMYRPTGFPGFVG